MAHKRHFSFFDNKIKTTSTQKPTRRYLMCEAKYLIRKVKVNRSLTPQQMLDATGRKQCTLPEFDNDHVLETMPRQGDEEVEVLFFRAGRKISAKDLASELKKNGLEADPYAQITVNIDDPSFADEHPNAVQWQGEEGNIYCLAFSQWQKERRLYYWPYDGTWFDSCWFGGVRRTSSVQISANISTLEQSKLELCPAFKFRRGHMPFHYEYWYEDGFTITDDMAPWVAPQYRKVEPGWSGWDIPGRTRKRILCTACKKIIVEVDERM